MGWGQRLAQDNTTSNWTASLSRSVWCKREPGGGLQGWGGVRKVSKGRGGCGCRTLGEEERSHSLFAVESVSSSADSAAWERALLSSSYSNRKDLPVLSGISPSVSDQRLDCLHLHIPSMCLAPVCTQQELMACLSSDSRLSLRTLTGAGPWDTQLEGACSRPSQTQQHRGGTIRGCWGSNWL